MNGVADSNSLNKPIKINLNICMHIFLFFIYIYFYIFLFFGLGKTKNTREVASRVHEQCEGN
jgi:hypothetical protein